MSRPFRFKRFSVIQDVSAMKVGTDGVLLGAWARLRPDDRRVLDIGAGTGLIALMLAQRSENMPLLIDALEIEKPSADEAQTNVDYSPWADRIEVINDSLQNYSTSASQNYDLIVSNPPFFVDSLPAPDQARTTARHAVSLTSGELISASARLLAEGGRLCVIIPAEQQEGFVAVARRSGLALSRVTHVYPKPGAMPKRSLLEFIKRPDLLGNPEQSTLTVELSDRHDYSPEYKSLTAGFYLKF